ncbi:MAG: hypothetical protein L3K19_06330 [Thermoplasmata archaeon]|nr:hypothetical protein [Thermoplasmata archaeon]
MGARESNARARPPSPNEPRDLRRAARNPRWITAGLLGLLMIAGGMSLATFATPARAASPSAPTAGLGVLAHPVPFNSTAPRATWAWGAAANVSVSATYVGAYNSSQALTGGNLTNSGAFVAVYESADVAYAVYAIVNVSTPSSGHLYVTVQSAEYRGVSLTVLGSGTFPMAGTYGPNVTPPLRPMNISLSATVQTLTAYSAYLNLTTGPNGSLSLNDEHVESLRAMNVSLDAVNFPNVTRPAGGGEQIRYTTGSVSASGFVAESLRASFVPALVIVRGPLFVGKSWGATSNVSFQGWAAYAEVDRASSGGSTASASKTGGASLNSTGPVNFTFRVTGTKTVYLPDGSTELDFVIAYTDGAGSGGVLLANGPLVLPASDVTKSAGLVQAVPEHAASAPLAQTAAPSGSLLYSPRHAMVDGQQSTPAGTSVVTAAPLSPAQASASMHGLGQPVAPSVAPRGSSPWGVVAAVFAVSGAIVGPLLVWTARRGGTRRG